MTLWMCLVTWIAGVVICTVPFAVMFIRGIAGESPDAFDVSMGTVVGFLTALLWPAVLVGLGVRRVVLGEVMQPKVDR